ncbi:hypothetical protein ECDEC15B_3491 [Escherichia coli DEC15B]|nr:hypothetical protein ECDEC15B_3491 [Escherichia coli DEC15B]
MPDALLLYCALLEQPASSTINATNALRTFHFFITVPSAFN